VSRASAALSRTTEARESPSGARATASSVATSGSPTAGVWMRYQPVERNSSVVTWSGHPQAALAGVTNGAPRINFNGYSFGNNNTNWPQTLGQQVLSIRDDFSYSFNKGGRHDVKTGGEYLNVFFYLYNCRPCVGIYDAANSRPPANIQQLIPVWNDPNTWNLNALNPLIRSYQIGIGEFGGEATRDTVAAWVQDDWQATERLTLNLGLRYDLQPNSFANFVEVVRGSGRPRITGADALASVEVIEAAYASAAESRWRPVRTAS